MVRRIAFVRTPAMAIGWQVVGCADEPPADPDSAVASSAVTFDGKPLHAGTITFESTAKSVGTSHQDSRGGKIDHRSGDDLHEPRLLHTESIRNGNPAAYVAIPSK